MALAWTPPSRIVPHPRPTIEPDRPVVKICWMSSRTGAAMTPGRFAQATFASMRKFGFPEVFGIGVALRSFGGVVPTGESTGFVLDVPDRAAETGTITPRRKTS